MILAIGELMYLMTFDVDKIPTPTSTIFSQNIATSIGNDAPIFSLLTASKNRNVSLFTNKISYKDSEQLLTKLNENNVCTKHIIQNSIETPRNICLREKTGQRTWILSNKVHFPKFETISINNYDLIYFDIYEELIALFIEFNKLFSKYQPNYYLNLSATSIIKKVKQLSLLKLRNIFAIQISMKEDIEIKELANFVSSKLNPKYLMITKNSKGAYLFHNTKAYYSNTISSSEAITSIGCGAAYSTSFINNAFKGLLPEEMNANAVVEATEFCNGKNNKIIRL